MQRETNRTAACAELTNARPWGNCALAVGRHEIYQGASCEPQVRTDSLDCVVQRVGKELHATYAMAEESTLSRELGEFVRLPGWFGHSLHRRRRGCRIILAETRGRTFNLLSHAWQGMVEIRIQTTLGMVASTISTICSHEVGFVVVVSVVAGTAYKVLPLCAPPA